MYKDIIGKKVVIIATTRANISLLRYEGTLKEEDNDELLLENTTITTLQSKGSANLFGGNTSFGTFGDNISKVIISKRYMISCNAN